jgi:two-component system sensor kinase FixL
MGMAHLTDEGPPNPSRERVPPISLKVMEAILILVSLFALGLATAVLAIAFIAMRRRAATRAFELANANRRLDAIFGQAAVGMACMDSDGRWLRVNDRFCEIAGYARDELMRLSVDEITHPDDLPHDHADRENLRAGQIDHSALEKRYLRKDGKVVWVNVTRSSIRDAAGHPDFFVVVAEEISARKEVETQLTTGEAQYRAIFDSAVEAMAVIDAEGTIQSVNPSVERVFGYRPGELIGRNVKLLMPKSVGSHHNFYLRRYRETGRRAIIGIGREVLGRRKGGSVFPLDLSVAEWQRDGTTFFTGVMREISARRDAETALQTSEDKLLLLQNEFAHLARVNDLGEMAAAIAHEINQPLTAITNYLNAGLSGPGDSAADPEIQEILSLASDQALRAGEIVRRLREFVGHGNGERTVESAQQLTDSAMAIALIDARSSGISVERLASAADAQVEVDAVQIQQVLVNLLRNAVDALGSDGPDEHRRLTVTTRKGPRRSVQFVVADNGPGISPDLSGRLFDPFVTTKPKGMGMGLSVCRRLIEAHGGTIEVESRPGHGATFMFQLPVLEQPGAEPN